MNTKLTLTIEQDVIEKAKLYAKSEHRSLSDIVENYLRLLSGNTSENHMKTANKSPITDSLKGSFKLPSDPDYKAELNKRRDEKFLK